ncbi:aminoglycoside phosphotransferase family protein (plasmid) [Deinococcus sp. KNUC1210]|uniref:phosphotransferase enzyme family protein n=1 Tax=Deinococcus sp. KNUC1210 TaxID=2917691 RepID=UPI001EF14075|nr:aminoglycoside phosphotransferase family protein [Deinococcus sp. KNUC1210]ULH17003.1 aminoglycoside phosphotransferase family protein [Deinococcus sp. KNUC1210]
MSVEPALDRMAMLAALGHTYGLTLDRLTFIPDGTTPAYRVEGQSGRYFLKVLIDTSYGGPLLDRLRAELPLLRSLVKRDILPNVPHPVSTLGGDDLTQIGGHWVVLYRWIEAETLSASWEASLPELGALLGRLHAATPLILEDISRLPMPPETFDLPFERQFLLDWKRLHEETHPAVQAFRDLLTPLEPLVFSVLNHAQALQEHARGHAGTQVVCHTDAHGGNVMRDQTGALWIIDWETARLAPPEHDLWMVHARLPEVLAAYREATQRPFRPDLGLMSFYMVRRVLEDLAVDLNAVLNAQFTDERRWESHRLLDGWIIPSLRRVEAEIAHLTRVLSPTGP